MIYDLIIIGGGPAGITAGIYAARETLNVLLITKGFGGQLTRKSVAIENYPGLPEIAGIDLIQKFEEHFKKFKVETKIDRVSELKKQGEIFEVITQDKNQYKTRSVIIASGANPRFLEVPGEKEFIGKGVSYCTTCDAPMFTDKIVAVVGGGNAGFEAALALTDYAKKIYIFEYSSELAADEDNQKTAKASEKVEVLTDVAIKQIKGEKFVNSVIYQDRKTKEERALEVQGVFVEIGSIPATSFANSWVEFDERGEIIADARTCETHTPGIFAAGDVTNTKYKQIIIAAAQGAKAALTAHKWLRLLKK